MKINLSVMSLIALTGAAITGCVQDEYDLSDVDTTTRLSVNDLTIPVNMDAVTLKTIIKPDADSKIKEIEVDFKKIYALQADGNFSSDAIKVNGFTTSSPNPQTASTTLVNLNVPGLPAGHFRYDIQEMAPRSFNYTYSGVDKSIISVEALGLEKNTFRVKFGFTGVPSSLAKSIKVTDLVIEMPAHLIGAVPSAGRYAAETGLWTIDSYEINNSVSGALSLSFSGVEFTENPIDANHNFTYSTQMRIRGGLMDLATDGGMAQITGIGLTADYTVDALKATTFTGVVEYNIDDLNVSPIELSDLPDFLTGAGTNIKIADPEILLAINNPVARYGLEYQTGLTLTAIRGGVRGESYSLNSPNYFTVKATTLEQMFDIKPASTPLRPGYTAVGFDALSNVLSGQGLPNSIAIDLVDPKVPRQRVQAFELGKALERVTGKYEIYAPLELGDGSVVVYSDKETGWNDEDVDAITITKLSLTATVKNNTSLDVVLAAYPLGTDQKRIPGVEITSNLVKAGAEQQIEIEMTGTVTHLDGIEYVATVTATGDQKVLSPDDTIELTDIRAKASGYYEKEL